VNADSLRSIGWIDETRDRSEGWPAPVKAFVPLGYEMYIRVLFPFQAPDGSPVPWREVTRRVGVELTAKAGITELSRTVFDSDEELVPMDTLDDASAEVLVELLEGPLGPTEACTFLYSSVDTSHVTPDLQPVEDSLKDESVIVGVGAISRSLDFDANYVWPSNRRWFFAKIIDSMGSGLLGCDRSTGQKILESEAIEAFVVSDSDDASFLFPRWDELS